MMCIKKRKLKQKSILSKMTKIARKERKRNMDRKAIKTKAIKTKAINAKAMKRMKNFGS
jgi:hypothetical protein